MLAFDSDLAPIVGQQITLDSNSDAATDARVDLLLERADEIFVSQILGGVVTEADIVVKGTVNGEQRGWQRLANGDYRSDRAAEADLTESNLRALAATPGQALTFSAVVPGDGYRIGIDRDADGALDGDDVCPDINNPDQADSDADGIGNVCDNCSSASNSDQRDTNGDGYGNLCDADLDNDGIVNFGDLSILANVFFTADANADLNGDGIVNFSDLQILSQAFFQAPGPSGLQ
ncbi:MAG: thrombospondin type 3 repeat-containing protein [Gammaproteobacteria bacterium]|nr:thrombospondin type 3 repeat-containing protein [Gammaproteobacteria bacterium]